jgi:hypothetical protein
MAILEEAAASTIDSDDLAEVVDPPRHCYGTGACAKDGSELILNNTRSYSLNGTEKGDPKDHRL